MPCVLSLLLFLALSSSQTSLQDTKEPSCRCDEKLNCICSHSGLRAVPSVSDQARTLDLDFNQITEIQRPDLARLRELRVLKIHANRLSKIDRLAFSSLWSLKELDLSQNLLTALDQRWFNKLGALESLKLHGNPYKYLGSHPPFQTLFRLRSLSFGGECLEEIKSSDLKGLGGLEQLRVDADNLTRYESGALAQIWPLDHVTVSLHSMFVSNQSLASAVLQDVSRPDTRLTLENLYLNDNRSVLPLKVVAQKRVRHFSAQNFFMTDETMVKFLEVTDGAVCSTMTMRNFTLSGVGSVWRRAKSAAARRLTPNVISLYSVTMTINLSVLFCFLFIKNVTLTNLLQHKHLTNQQIFVLVDSQVYMMPCLTSLLLKNLQYLDLSENLLTDPALIETLCNGAGTLHDLRVLNISANSIKSLPLISRMVFRLPKLSHLDVSRNSLSVMPQTCLWPESLRFLNISRTKLTSATSCLPPTLRVLDLSYNDLVEFFVFLPALRELYLSGNKLLTLPPGRLFPNLQTLTAQSNTLNLFSRSDLLSFPRLQNFEAGFNKFVCSCNFVPFFHSLSNGETNVTLTDGINSYFCDSPLRLQGAPLSLVHRSFTECHHVLFVSISCGVALVFLMVLGVVLWKVHAFWYLKMIFVWLKAKQRRRRRQRQREENGDEEEFLVTFDAFVSYSERDSAWVDNYLLPKLEQTGCESSTDLGPEFAAGTCSESKPQSTTEIGPEIKVHTSESTSESSPESKPQSSPEFKPSPRPEPLRLCLHRRDFLPGRWIMDNIVTAIESSRKTLFVLSHNFVQSDWCKYELDFTHFQLLEGNCREDAAILVLLEPLSHDDVPKRFCRLRKLLSSTTYLHWPQDPEHRDQFWTSLRQALRPDQD
ncbi:hypothetical protein WMY93_014169 [Mugilogobius chulae]|uniref:TIR domain-containing protein n=1 Tax=Mugilogobius chulae TaxID=88201 RepID=A0AAW0P5U0_9GOBI